MPPASVLPRKVNIRPAQAEEDKYFRNILCEILENLKVI